MRRVMYDRELHAMLDALRVAFGEGVFGKAYPGVRAPYAVTVGGDAEEPAFEVALLPFPSSVSNERRVACPGITTAFDMQVFLRVGGATYEDALTALYAYVDCVHQAFLADPSLGGDLGSVSPQFSRAGIDNDGSYGFVATALVTLRLTRDWEPNRTIARAIREKAR